MRDDLAELGETLWPDVDRLRPDRAAGDRDARWRTRGRRRLAVGSVGAVTIVASAAALVLVNHRIAGSPPPAPSSPATTVRPAALVPWADIGAPQTEKPFTIPGVPACPAASLTFDVRVADESYIGAGSANSASWAIRVRNVGPAACFVGPTLDATFTTGGRRLNLARAALYPQHIVYLVPASQAPRAGFATEAVGEIGSFGDCHLPATAGITLSPGPGLGSVAVTPGPAGGTGGLDCASGGGQYFVELAATGIGTVTGAPLDVMTQVTMHAPASVHAGERLRYTVTIEDMPQPWIKCMVGTCPTPLPKLAFTPCPAYHQELEGLSGTFGTFRLNCAQTPTITAGGSVSFEMYVDVPPTAPPGPTVLTWTLDFPQGSVEQASSFLEIETPG